MISVKNDFQSKFLTSSTFKHPIEIADSWDKNALYQVEIWLRKSINRLPIGEKIKISAIGRASRTIAHILPHGNIDGVRYLLWKLNSEGCVEVQDNLYFVVHKIFE